MDLRGSIAYHLHRLTQALYGFWCQECMYVIKHVKGIDLDHGCSCVGVPYFYRTPHSTLHVGRGSKILSSFRSNHIGSMSRSRLCTLTPTARLVIGQRVGMSAVTITVHDSIEIGDDTQIGAGTVIIDSDFHDLSPDVEARHHRLGPTAPVRIGCNVFIGTRCLILKGVTIGDHAVVGAGSVVTRDIPAGAVAAGNPCRVLRQGLATPSAIQ